MAPEGHARPVGTADRSPRQCHHQAQGAVDDVAIGGDGRDLPDVGRQAVRLGPEKRFGNLARLLRVEVTTHWVGVFQTDHFRHARDVEHAQDHGRR